VFRAFFQDDRDISDPAVVAQVAQSIGLDGPALMEAAQAPALKDELRRRVEEAVAFGVFGAPTIVVDGEVFWGNDRLPQIERWLASGPF
jgi:2-hydroxychromene-2-carboxylate isomerase